jgi:hypothetical protein
MQVRNLKQERLHTARRDRHSACILAAGVTGILALLLAVLGPSTLSASERPASGLRSTEATFDPGASRRRDRARPSVANIPAKSVFRLAALMEAEPEPASTLSLPPASEAVSPEEAQSWLTEVEQQFPDRVRLHTPGYSAEGRPIRAIELGNLIETTEPHPRLAILCRQHGDEPETTAAALELIYRLLTADPALTDEVLQKASLLIVPIANPDGAIWNARANAQGWGTRQVEEVNHLSSLLEEWKPTLVLDVHQWVPGDSCQTPLLEASGGRRAQAIAAGMQQGCRASGYRFALKTKRSSDTHLCHRYYGMRAHIPAILLETRHVTNSTVARGKAIHASVLALLCALELLVPESLG